MLGKPSVSAIRSLLLLAGQDVQEPCSPRRIADELGESPTYLAKGAPAPGKGWHSGIGARGKGRGDTDGQPAQITLLAIVEACRGTIVGDYCKSSVAGTPCAFHRAAVELYLAITGVLERWTLADPLAGPFKPGVPKPVDHVVVALLPWWEPQKEYVHDYDRRAGARSGTFRTSRRLPPAD